MEIEYYEPEHAKASAVYGPHWERPYAAEKFAGKGYVCQGLSHGTLECDEGEKESYRRFIGEVLGLQVASAAAGRLIRKDVLNPWYVVVVPQKIRRYLNENSRFTLEIDSSEVVREAHQEFAKIANDVRLTYLGELREENGRSYFFRKRPRKKLVGDNHTQMKVTSRGVNSI